MLRTLDAQPQAASLPSDHKKGMIRRAINPEIAQEVADSLFSVEEKLDAAMQETARFTAQLVEVRAKAGLSVMIGQDALEGASAAMVALAQVRRELVKTHGHLADDQLRLGIRTTRMGGPFSDKIPQGRQIAVVGDDVAA